MQRHQALQSRSIPKAHVISGCALSSFPHLLMGLPLFLCVTSITLKSSCHMCITIMDYVHGLADMVWVKKVQGNHVSEHGETGGVHLEQRQRFVETAVKHWIGIYKQMPDVQLSYGVSECPLVCFGFH